MSRNIPLEVRNLRIKNFNNDDEKNKISELIKEYDSLDKPKCNPLPIGIAPFHLYQLNLLFASSVIHNIYNDDTLSPKDDEVFGSKSETPKSETIKFILQKWYDEGYIFDDDIWYVYTNSWSNDISKNKLYFDIINKYYKNYN